MTASRSKTPSVLELTRALSFTSMLEEHEIHAFAKVLIRRRYGEGEVIFQSGQGAQQLSMLVSGKVTVSKSLGATKKTVQTIEPSMIFGHIGLLSTQPHATTAVASTESVVLALPREMFDRVVRSDSPLALKLMIPIVTACCRAARSNQQMLHGLFADPHGTLTELLTS